MASPHLTERQLDVLQRACSGQTNETIARELGLSPSTIRQYRSTIRRRFGNTPFSAICRMLETEGSSEITPNFSAIPTNTENQFPEFRIEHHAEDGTVRLLASTSVESIAIGSAYSWARLLRRQAKLGVVVVVDPRTGAAIFSILIESQ